MAERHEVAIKPDIVFAEHDGVTLLGDLYRPKGIHKAPVLVAAHGGGWQLGDRKFYRHWGNYLAKNGYAVFAIEYRLMKPGVRTGPVSSATPRRRCNSFAPRPPSSGSIPSASR